MTRQIGPQGNAIISEFLVSLDPTAGYYTVIQDAINDAYALTPTSDAQIVIWIQPGTYSESLTLYPFINLAGSVDPSTGSVSIVGNATYTDNSMSGTNQFSATNIGFTSSSSGPALYFTGSGTTLAHLQSVALNATASGCIGLQCDGPNMTLNLSIGSLTAASGAQCKNVSAGFVEMYAGTSNFTDTASTISGGEVNILSSNIYDSFDVTGGILYLYQVYCDTSATSLACIALSSASCYLSNSTFNCENANFITGTGDCLYGNLTALTGATIQNTIDQFGLPNLSGNISFDGGTTLLNTDGEVWIGSSSGIPVPATLTAGSGISIANASNSITISATAGGFTWSVITTNVIAAAENGYMTNNGSLISIALPSTSALGDTFEVLDPVGGLFQITQGSGQNIQIGNLSTTVGTGGSLTSTSQGDSLQLICYVADTTWVAIQNGLFTVV